MQIVAYLALSLGLGLVGHERPNDDLPAVGPDVCDKRLQTISGALVILDGAGSTAAGPCGDFSRWGGERAAAAEGRVVGIGGELPGGQVIHDEVELALSVLQERC